ncbi:MAG: adenylate/guanylate cyclase domain-containing protein [Burkholderiales bacterium]
MTSPPVKRKLAAILAADAVGYSRAMATDEEGTMKILAAHRAVIDGIIQFHEGRIVNTAGDSVLADFASPTQAVRCAVEIQDALKTRNDSLPEERRMQFRIGVNLGDVMIKGDDLLGDGVNVAARLESIAEPGNIYVSSSVYDQIAGKLDLGFSDLGEQSLKNIDRPVRAYRVDRDKRATPALARRPKRSPMPWIAAALGVVAVGGGASWYVAQLSAARQVEEAKAKVEAEAAKARADAELAKARAEAEEAKKTAAAAADSAIAAKRALDEQRIVEARARAQSELASARAEAEATRRRADMELAAAADARRSAEAATRSASAAKPAAAKAIPSYAGAWRATFTCVPFQELPTEKFEVPVTFSNEKFEMQRGKLQEPGSLTLTGTPKPDGTLQMQGQGYSKRQQTVGQTFPMSFNGKLSADRYEARGKLGSRDCAMDMVRSTAPTQASLAPQGAPAATAGTALGFYAGQWAGTFSCSGGNDPPRSFPAQVTYSGKGFEVQSGKPDTPGFRQLAGVPQPDGSLRLAGKALGGPKTGFYTASVDGKFTGDRYSGSGKFQERDCTLAMSRSSPQAAASAGTQWWGTMVCVALGSEGAREWPMAVTVSGDRVEVRGGKSGQPGWLEMAGVRKTDSTLRLTGAGLSGMKEYLGQSFKAEFDGKFSGERYQGKGRLGTRECTLTMARN